MVLPQYYPDLDTLSPDSGRIRPFFSPIPALKYHLLDTGLGVMARQPMEANGFPVGPPPRES